MKIFLLPIIGLAGILSAKAQESDSLKKLAADTSVHAVVQTPPEFPGGTNEFLKFIAKNIRYPAEARMVNKQGKVIVQFIVEKNGSVTNARVIRPLFPAIDKEAIRVVSSSPKWKPGGQNGYRLRVVYTVPITFNLSTHVYFSNR